MMKRALIISLIIVSVLLIFTLQNQEQVIYVNFMFWKISHTFVVIVSLLFGLLLGLAVIFPALVRKNRKIDDLNSFVQNFREKERKRVEENETREMNQKVEDKPE